MRPLLPALTVTALSVTPALAADLTVSFETPELNVTAYQRPFVAIWLENSAQERTTDLAVLYKQRDGQKWLKDLRNWWRKGGLETVMPADGVSGATKPPGVHSIVVPAARLAKLPAGDYSVMVEVAREHGGREVLTLPLKLPLRATPVRSTSGATEVKTVSVLVK